MLRPVHSELIDHHFDLVDRPRRIVSLVSSASEAIHEMGLVERLVGVSAYCGRYLSKPAPPVVGEYLTGDFEKIVALEPDLVLTTTGIQRKLAMKMAARGLPVFALPLPMGFHGMLENHLLLGRLMNELEVARQLNRHMERSAMLLRKKAGGQRPRVYVELWLGRHMRAVGGGSFIHDLLEIAGADLLFAERTDGYFTPDFDEVAVGQPDIHLFFHEPEYLIDPRHLVKERGWEVRTPLVVSTVDRGRNVIQDGPSFLESAAWLQEEIQRVYR
ncbi:MAG: ABC transporter substrate-binding protein [Verrucomicrobiales bacterium]